MSGNPLDFSFLKLQTVESTASHVDLVGLRKEEPRSGRRKPIEESEDEEEQKKVRAIKCIWVEREPVRAVVAGRQERLGQAAEGAEGERYQGNQQPTGRQHTRQQ